MRSPPLRPDATIVSILLNAEREAPDQPGLYVHDRVLTFSEIADRSRRMAAVLAGLGVRKGERVAILLPNSAAFVISHYALALLGAVIVPINPRVGGEVVRYVLEKSAALCVIGTETLVGALPGRMPAVVVSDDGDFVQTRGAGRADAEPPLALHQLAPLDMPSSSTAEDPAVLFFTSGTTGTPKGVLLSQAQVMFGVDAWANRWSFDHRTISLMAAPFFHVVYNPLVLGAHRRLGATVVQANLTVRAVTAAVERYRVTALMSTPAFMYQLASDRWATRNDLSSLDTIIYGAAPTPPSVVRALGTYFPGAGRYNCYGMTETSSALTCLAEPDIAGREASVGPPHAGVRLRIVDGDGRDAPPGGLGEVCANGPNVIARYFDAPDVDARRFFGEWLRTGDVGYVDADGYLYLVDRVDDQINIAGEKFYPSEIEDILLADPAVGEAAAVGVPDALKGQVVHAFVVAASGAAVDLDALRRRCMETLPPCAVPRRIAILDEIPRNPTGKVLRRDLVSLVDS